MRWILRTGICLLGLSAILAACGQNEGGRCQVDSDCGSGLSCNNPAYGNGICKPTGYHSTSDAATNDDTGETPSTSLDLGPDAPSSSALDLASVDSESVDVSGID